MPFDVYPGRGRRLLGPLRNKDDCRHGCGRQLMQVTGQTRCAYCGVDFAQDYYTWLLQQVDHVVPTNTAAKRLGIPQEMREDITNLVIACAGCNSFCNQYDDPNEVPPEAGWTEELFFDLRDRMFEKRLQVVAERRNQEVAFFNSQPWLAQDQAGD